MKLIYRFGLVALFFILPGVAYTEEESLDEYEQKLQMRNDSQIDTYEKQLKLQYAQHRKQTDESKAHLNRVFIGLFVVLAVFLGFVYYVNQKRANLILSQNEKMIELLSVIASEIPSESKTEHLLSPDSQETKE